MFAPILRYRGLIYAVTLREVKSRYIGSTLGPLWLIVPPIFMVFIYTVIFSQIMRARMPGVDHQYAYSVYLCAGLIAWNLLLELVQRSKGVFLEHSNLIKKSSFPKFILFVPVLLVALLNSVILTLLVLGFMYLSGFPMPPSIAYLAPVLMVVVMLGLVTGALLANLNVFFRDVGQLTDIVFQALFWATPIVYPVGILAEPVQAVLAWSPLYPLIVNAQNSLLGQAVSLQQLLYPFSVSLLVLALAIVLYRRSYADLLDQI
ncbi:ABC transporter permease [Stutzerimonas zhaodongensis]|uniref:Transport permease protein n=1 Tax=Stutzerimonas zhaodongensis TaxID=1176257 RepID=A0A365PQP5_9GAMM|nr:ABC transporter permease [Stutzerimonas zhaodongensis]RBA52993.1 ABC transporter permease [Stutzerimonas zhaodongensis]